MSAKNPFSINTANLAKVTILCLSFTALQAQNSESPFHFGIHGSPNFSYISTQDENIESGVKLKFGFGLMAEFDFAENYAFSTGINIVSRGGKMTATVDSILTVGEYNSQFLQLPVLLKMSTRQFGYSTYFAEFGGSIDLELSEEVKFNPNPMTAPLDSYVNFFNAMFIIGAGMEYNLGGTTNLILGIYYNRSLIDNLNEADDHILVKKANAYRFDYVNVKIGVLF